MNGEFISYIIILAVIWQILKFVIAGRIYGNKKIPKEKQDEEYKAWNMTLNIVCAFIGIIFLVNAFKG